MRTKAVVIIAVTLIAAACTGNHAAQGSKQSVVTPTPEPGATTSAPGSGGTTTTAAALPGGPSASAPSAAPVNVAPPAPGAVEHTSAGTTYSVANLFSAAQDRAGWGAKQITICAHAPLVFGSVFNDSAKDFTVYWQWLNAHGGIFGHNVNMVFTDDQYTPQGGVQAAQQCAQSNPFFMTAGVGFDTVPAVRQWAEQNKMLYLSSFATENGLYNLKYTFQLQPSVEQFGRVAGAYASAKYPGKYGVVWRNSPNWQGGRDQFEAVAKAHGQKVVADIPVQENQGDYTAAILKLQSSGAQTVFAWMNVLEFAQFEKQAAAQGYHPRWMTATFNLVTQTLGHDIDGSGGRPAAVGLWVTPEFHLGDTTSPWAPAEQQMEAAYAAYDKNHPITDTDWQAWLAFEGLGKMLQDCGADCSRNKLAGMLLAGAKAQLPPLCPIDFSRGRGRLGSFAFNVMEATNRNGSAS